jgi:hypothetical protein
MPDNQEATLTRNEHASADEEKLGVPGLLAQIENLRKTYPELEWAALRRILRLPDTPEGM